MKKEWHRKAMLVRGIDSGNVVLRRTVVPADVQSDCDRRMRLQPRSLIAELQGDPLPGYSMLDRKSA